MLYDEPDRDGVLKLHQQTLLRDETIRNKTHHMISELILFEVSSSFTAYSIRALLSGRL